MPKLIKFTPYLVLGVAWHYISTLNKDDAKKNAYNKGYVLSQKFKKYPSWDKYAEPFIINQFSFVFGVSNSFINGLVSDNKPNPLLEESLNELKKELDNNYTNRT